MMYQLMPPVKKAEFAEEVCAWRHLPAAVCAGGEETMYTGLPRELIPAPDAGAGEGFFYQAGEVSGISAPSQAQGYTLKIAQTGIAIAAADAAGLRYGLDTLGQILDQAGERVQCLEITDYPTIRDRGLMLDVSRGKVYTLDYLLGLAELLSKLRYTVLQLYMEHPFAFAKHPEIWAGSDPLTAEDIRVLQRRCRELGIELQANLQCLGHCRRILTRPEHMDLAESEMFWSLCTTDDRAVQLIDDLFSEYLPLFDSQWVNICFDEPHDIGRGRSAGAGEDSAALYVHFLKKIHGLAAKYGKRIMLFGDVVTRHPEMLAQLPKDIRYLDWCYDPKPHYGTPAIFDSYHLDYWISPGSGNWNTLFPRLDGSLMNVDQLLSEAVAAHAGGMLFTDWNDHGGYTQPAAGYYAYGYAAAAAWAGGGLAAEAVDAYLDRVLSMPGYARTVRTLAKIYQLPPIWSKNRSECVMALFDEPIFGNAIRGPVPPEGLRAYDLSLPEGAQPVLERHSQHPLRPYFSIPAATCEKIAELAREAKLLAQALPRGAARDQLVYQADAFLLMTDKLAMSRKIIARVSADGLTVRDILGLEEDVRVMLQRFVRLQLKFIQLWMQVARPSEIDISLVYFAHILERLDYLRDWLSLKREAMSRGETVCMDFSDYETAGYTTLPTY